MKQIISILFFISCLPACKKYLQAAPDNGIIPETVADYTTLLNGEGWGKMVSLPDGAPQFFFLDMLTEDVGEKASGDPVGEKADYSAFYTWQNQYDFQRDAKHTPSSLLNDTWQGLYRIVQTCNIILAAGDKMKGDPGERQFLVGDAHFSRALAYYFLVNIWGRPYDPANPDDPMGVPLKTSPDIGTAGFPRQSVTAVYQLMLSDLEEAETNIKTSGLSRKSIFHYSPEAIYLLRSRLHLYQQDWEQTVTYAGKCLDNKSGLYDITHVDYSGYADFFDPADNPEVIYTFNNTVTTGSVTIFGDVYNYCFRISPDLQNSYDPADQRSPAYFENYDSLLMPETFDPYYAPASHYRFCFRTAEAYLNRAEANAHLGNLAAALADLNRLRRNRINAAADLAVTDKDSLLEQILLERRKELPFQLHHWFDLRRTGMPELTHYFTPVTNGAPQPRQKFVLHKKDPGYTLEIPEPALASDPSLKPLGLPVRSPE